MLVLRYTIHNTQQQLILFHSEHKNNNNKMNFSGAFISFINGIEFWLLTGMGHFVPLHLQTPRWRLDVWLFRTFLVLQEIHYNLSLRSGFWICVSSLHLYSWNYFIYESDYCVFVWHFWTWRFYHNVGTRMKGLQCEFLHASSYLKDLCPLFHMFYKCKNHYPV